MDVLFFLNFLSADDILRLSRLPEAAIADLKALFASAPGIGETSGKAFGDIRALLHYHKACSHIFIRELDIASGEYQGCLANKSGCPELCGGSFKELLALGFHFDFAWDANASFALAMSFKVPDSDEEIEIPEWFSYAPADYRRGMAALRGRLGKRANAIHLNWMAGFARGREEMEENGDVPACMPDDLQAGCFWNFELEIKRDDNFIHYLVAFPHMEHIVLSIHSRAIDPGSQISGKRGDGQFYALARKDFVSPAGLDRHMPGIIKRIEIILGREI